MAGMIDYNRRAKRAAASEVISQPATTQSIQKTQEKTTSRYNRYSKKTEKKSDINQLLASKPEVSNRIERLYDVNRDGLLQEDEVLEYLKGVVTTIDRRGRFTVGSNILKKFDRNNDGSISKYEVQSLKDMIK